MVQEPRAFSRCRRCLDTITHHRRAVHVAAMPVLRGPATASPVAVASAGIPVRAYWQ